MNKTKQKNKMFDIVFFFRSSTFSYVSYILLPKLIHTIDNSESQFHQQSERLS